jgi:hypothetical protein
MIKGVNRKYRLIWESRFLISSRSRARVVLGHPKAFAPDKYLVVFVSE